MIGVSRLEKLLHDKREIDNDNIALLHSLSHWIEGDYLKQVWKREKKVMADEYFLDQFRMMLEAKYNTEIIAHKPPMKFIEFVFKKFFQISKSSRHAMQEIMVFFKTADNVNYVFSRSNVQKTWQKFYT